MQIVISCLLRTSLCTYVSGFQLLICFYCAHGYFTNEFMRIGFQNDEGVRTFAEKIASVPGIHMCIYYLLCNVYVNTFGYVTSDVTMNSRSGTSLLVNQGLPSSLRTAIKLLIISCPPMTTCEPARRGPAITNGQSSV